MGRIGQEKRDKLLGKYVAMTKSLFYLYKIFLLVFLCVCEISYRHFLTGFKRKQTVTA